MRLGIFGGTFDPVHYGHLLLAETCREAQQLDEVWFMPTAIPPHKQGRALTSAAQRVEMLELAVSGDPTMRVSTYEIDRGGVNFTVDTLAHLKSEDASRELYFLMGADSLRDLHNWKDPRTLCELATPVVVARDKANDPPELDLAALGDILPESSLARIRAHRVAMPRIEISSSDLRHRVSSGRSIRYRTPRAVEKYIEAHRLYQSPAPSP